MSAPFRYALIALCAATLLAHLCTSIPQSRGGWLLLGCALVLVTACRNRNWPLGGIIICAALAGALNTWQAAGAVLEYRYDMRQDSPDRIISGWIVGLPVSKPLAHSEAISTRITLQSRSDPDYKVQLYWLDAPEIIPGQCWKLKVRLSEVRGQSNPGGFDLTRWAARYNIAANGQVKGVEGRCEARDAEIDTLRQRLSAQLKQQLGGGVAALALGDGSGLTEQEWHLLRVTGTLHLAVISGMHIALVAMLIWKLGVWLLRLPGLRRVLLLRPRAYWLCIPAVLASLAYSLLAGWDTPVQRSFLMIAVLFGDRLMSYPIAAYDRWLAALAAVLWFDPLAPLAPGFWLSFAAVAVLLVLQNRYRRDPIRSWWQWPARAIHLQITLSLSLAPFMFLSIGQIPLLGPLANLLVGFLFNLALVPMSLLAAALVNWVDLSSWQPLYEFMFDSVYGLLNAVAWEESLWLENISLLVLIPIAAIALMPMRFWLLLPLTALPMALSDDSDSSLDITFFDVGQGSAVLVQAEGYRMLYDTGTERMAKRVVVPGLRALGVHRLDALVISHGDSDHAGGSRLIIEQLQPARLFSSDPQAIAAGAEPCLAGMQVSIDDFSWRALWPTTAGHGNDSSCVLLLNSRYGSVLLTGDITVRSEYQLMRLNTPWESPLLLVPHHGSRSSSGADWLRSLGTRSAVFSARYPSPFGHPHPEIWRRYQTLGIRRYLTGLNGAVRVIMTANTATEVELWRARQPRWWSLYYTLP